MNLAPARLPSPAAAREVVRKSFQLEAVTPRDAAQWATLAKRVE